MGKRLSIFFVKCHNLQYRSVFAGWRLNFRSGGQTNRGSSTIDRNASGQFSFSQDKERSLGLIYLAIHDHDHHASAARYKFSLN